MIQNMNSVTMLVTMVLHEMMFSKTRQTLELNAIVSEHKTALHALRSQIKKQSKTIPVSRSLKTKDRVPTKIDSTAMPRAFSAFLTMYPSVMYFKVFPVGSDMQESVNATVRKLYTDEITNSGIPDIRNERNAIRRRELLQEIADDYRRAHPKKHFVAPQFENWTDTHKNIVSLVCNVMNEIWTGITRFYPIVRATATEKPNFEKYIVALLYMMAEGYKVKVSTDMDIVVVPVVDVLKYLPMEGTLSQYISIKTFVPQFKQIREIHGEIRSIFDDIRKLGRIHEVEINIMKFC